ncbi:doubled CXXCH domain-containing protein [Rhizobiales bacterium GAS113]|nr:doubled CXXCH domain-containing protein [Rhizobiales bacterium GAS113]
MTLRGNRVRKLREPDRRDGPTSLAKDRPAQPSVPSGAMPWRRSVIIAACVTVALVASAIAYVFNIRMKTMATSEVAAIADASQQSASHRASAAYVGSDACAQCHAAEAKAWGGSHHALAMQHANDSTVLGDFADAELSYGDVTSAFLKQDAKFMVRTDGPDGSLQNYEVKFTFGVAPLQQYLVELPGGRLQALAIAWDSRPKAEGGQRWFHLNPGEAIAHGDPLHWTGLQMNWNFMCAECHTTNLKRNFDAATQTYHTTYSEIDVSCESCHGPGSRHLAWAQKAPSWESIDGASKGLTNLLEERKDVTWLPNAQTGNSARSKPRTTMHEIETCAVCHSRRGPIWSDVMPGAPIGDGHRVSLLDEGLYFPDGQIRDEVYEYGSFLQSRMNHAGVTCSDCHEPHSAKLRAEGNGVCLQCHSPAKYQVASHHHHKDESVESQCVSCHMPERTFMVVDRRRDHSLRIPRPDRTTTLGVPNACSTCHADKSAAWAADQLKTWFPTPDPGFQQFAEVLQEGTMGAPGAREKLLALAGDTGAPGIARASALARLDRVPSREALDHLRRLIHDQDPLIRRAAVCAYINLPANARMDLLPMLDDPVRDVRLQAVPLIASIPPQSLDADARRRLDRGIAEYTTSEQSNADRPEAHFNLGLVFVALGRTAAAEAEFRVALAIDPTFVPAAVSIADLYRSAGLDAQGESVLRTLIEHQPYAALAHHALGLWLVRNQRTAEALEELRRAADLGPEDPRMAYVYAVALTSKGDRNRALEVLRRQLARFPYHRDSLYAMATIERDAGDVEAARRYAEQLVALEPNEPSFAQLLGQLKR